MVLLITKASGIDDQELRHITRRLRGEQDVALFHSYARDIADYSRIAEGVDVDRVPALVAISATRRRWRRPPVATIDYGFRGYESVHQAVRDAELRRQAHLTRYYPDSPASGRAGSCGAASLGAVARPEPLEHYLRDDSRRAPAPADAFTGAAGGARCGDLVRISLTVGDGRDRRRPPSTPRAAPQPVPRRGRRASWSRARRCLTRPASAPATSRRARRPTAQGAHAADLAADALHRALSAAAGSRRPAGAAAGRASASRSRSAAASTRAVAALLERERGAEVVAVTVKLWADRHNDGARSCCSPQAVLGASGLAHSLGIPHLTLDLEQAFRSTVVADFLAGHATGPTPNPCVLCNG